MRPTAARTNRTPSWEAGFDFSGGGRQMEIVRKLKFLIAAYLSVLFFLLLSVIAMPLVIRQGLSLTPTFVIEEESLETALIVLLFGVSFFILKGFKRALGAYERAAESAGLDKSRLMSRLTDAFSYIGAVNVEIKEIESIICGVAYYPRTRKEFKRLLDQLGGKVTAVAGAPWLVIRMINRSTGRTVKEHFVEARKGALPSATMGNRDILEGRRVDGFRAIGPRRQNLDLLTVCILPATSLSEEDVVLITAIANQIEMLFLIYRDGCALAQSSEAADKPCSLIKEPFHDSHN
jgi:hypothetical protein